MCTPTGNDNIYQSPTSDVLIKRAYRLVIICTCVTHQIHMSTLVLDYLWTPRTTATPFHWGMHFTCGCEDPHLIATTHGKHSLLLAKNRGDRRMVIKPIIAGSRFQKISFGFRSPDQFSSLLL